MNSNIMKNNILMNIFYYTNSMNYMNQNLYYQQLNNQMVMNPMMNCNYFPYQFYQNKFNNCQIPYWTKKNVFLMNNTNKFNINCSNKIQKSLFSKNNKLNENNEYDGLKNEETSFFEKEIKIKKTKKLSIDSNDSNCSDLTSDEEKIGLDENKEEKKHNLNINDLENKNDIKDDECIFPEGKKCGRRYSNISKVSTCSKCSKSTNYSSISSLKEKDVLEKNEKFEKNDVQNKKENKVEEYQGNPDFENTEILNVNVKISKDKTAIFKLKRYDDLFLTIKLFCEINSIDEKLIKPIIIKSLTTLNTIYQVMNTKLDKEQINILKNVKKNL